VDSSGNLYGTTGQGGAHGHGTVYERAFDAKTGKWTQTVLYSFCALAGCADGQLPVGRLVLDKGNIFGATLEGGAGYGGTIYELSMIPTTKKWREKVLYSFCSKSSCTDGQYPPAGPIMDASENIYGMTKVGGTANSGTIYELVARPFSGTWTEKVLHSFGAQAGDLVTPYADLIMDSAGTLYGTASAGGDDLSDIGGVFEMTLDPVTKKRTLTVIHYFTGNGAGEGFPSVTGLIMDCGKSVNGVYGCTGSIYGTTDGTVIKLTPDGSNPLWTDDVLYVFCPDNDCTPMGSSPSSLIIDAAGNLFGSNSKYGTGVACEFALGCGAAFELILNSTRSAVTGYRVLHEFCSSGGGEYAACTDGIGGGALTFDSSGNLYGTSGGGGKYCYNINADGCGEVFEFKK